MGRLGTISRANNKKPGEWEDSPGLGMKKEKVWFLETTDRPRESIGRFLIFL